MCGMSHTKNLVQNYSDHFGNSQRSSLSPTGGAKSTSPTTEKWLRKLYVYNNNINMSNEDNKHDTNYINKSDTNNHDARKLHE